MHTRIWHYHWPRTHLILSQSHSRRRRGAWLRALGLVALLLAVSAELGVSFCSAKSDAPSPNARDILKRGTIEAGGTVGYWQALRFPFQESSAHPHRSAVFIMPRIGMVVTDDMPIRLTPNTRMGSGCCAVSGLRPTIWCITRS